MLMSKKVRGKSQLMVAMTNTLKFDHWATNGDAVFVCHSYSGKGDYVEYEVHLDGFELRNIRNAPPKTGNVVNMIDHLMKEVEDK